MRVGQRGGQRHAVEQREERRAARAAPPSAGCAGSRACPPAPGRRRPGRRAGRAPAAGGRAPLPPGSRRGGQGFAHRAHQVAEDRLQVLVGRIHLAARPPPARPRPARRRTRRGARSAPSPTRPRAPKVSDSTWGAPTTARASARGSRARRATVCGCSSMRSRISRTSPFGQDAAVVDEQHAPRHGLHLVQDVAGDHDGAALAAQPLHEVHHAAAVDGVHARERLVQQQHLRVVGQGLGQLDAAGACPCCSRRSCGRCASGEVHHLERGLARGARTPPRRSRSGAAAPSGTARP